MQVDATALRELATGRAGNRVNNIRGVNGLDGVLRLSSCPRPGSIYGTAAAERLDTQGSPRQGTFAGEQVKQS
jgi:hypothetical protein